MTLVIEDGTIVAGAESYCTVAVCDTYHTNNNNAAWGAALTAAKEAALRKATRYIDGHYRNRWKGCRVQPAKQPLEWPRAGVCIGGNIPAGCGSYHFGFGTGAYIPSDQIPQRLKDAQCELALRALATDLAADADASIQHEKIDVIETTYRSGITPGQKSYPVVDQLLSDYLKNSNDLIRG